MAADGVCGFDTRECSPSPPFVTVDHETNWPIVTITYLHADISEADARTYFETLSGILNDKATLEAPCFLLFDASKFKLKTAMDVPSWFTKQHNAFNKAYYDRLNAVCRAFAIIVNNPAIRMLVTTALTLTPAKQVCKNFTSSSQGLKFLREMATSEALDA